MRQIINLEVPTFNMMKRVMFHDVLMKLCFQAVKLHSKQDEVNAIKRKIIVLKKMGNGMMNDDTLEAVYNRQTKVNSFDNEIIGLHDLLEEPEPKAELVKELKEKLRELKKQYNT